MSEYLADTYAFIEIIRGNTNYQRYATAQLRTTQHQLAELLYWAIRKENTQARTLVFRLWKYTASLSASTMFFAMKLKHKHRKNKLSYADCIGYATAAQLEIPFLTGDEQFKDMPNVEFVK
ncbi:MAG: PIN domain-containing protein [Candidatus Woesearchaeota archaeon]